MSGETEIQWKQNDMVEVVLSEPDDFLKVRETLTRIGVASRKEKKIYQSCHILHKQGKYYIVHFKELFALDGKNTNFSLNDFQRRNRIAQLLSDWGLINVCVEDSIIDIAPLNQIKVLPYKEKSEWALLNLSIILVVRNRKPNNIFRFIHHINQGYHYKYLRKRCGTMVPLLLQV